MWDFGVSGISQFLFHLCQLILFQGMLKCYLSYWFKDKKLLAACRNRKENVLQGWRIKSPSGGKLDKTDIETLKVERSTGNELTEREWRQPESFILLHTEDTSTKITENKHFMPNEYTIHILVKLNIN